MAKEYVLITGASMGLGKALAREYALHGKNLILVSLPGEGLQLLAENIRMEFNVDVQLFEADLSENGSIYKLAEWVNLNFDVSYLINNAGIGGTSVFEKCPVEYIDRVIMLNIRSLSVLTRLLLPNLKKQPNARILNVASMASFCPMTFKAVYSASKAYVYYFSRALAEELRETNVCVSVVHPGPMKTNPAVTRNIELQGWFASLCGLLPAEQIASNIRQKLEKGKRFIVPGLMNKFNWIVMRAVPIPLQLNLGYKITSKEI
jgi:hypothetical protein